MCTRDKYIDDVLCLVIVNVNVTECVPQKCQICLYQIMFFHAPNAPKLVFGRVSAPDPAVGAYDAPPDSLVGGERHTLSQYPYPMS